ncbi:MAG: pilus assembly PilX N-terminal domain-containing protein, partial [Desulfobacterales bacterium]|nr:pilus assembly PilX N-terminal domain-containing protein [Desulfobacterales bacterium]
MKTISAINNERGIVLIVALMFLTLLSVLGAAGIMTSTMDMKIACANRSAAKALHIAEAGLTRAEAELINDLDTDQNIGNTSFEATSGTITITPSASFYTVFNAISFGEGSYTIQLRNYGTAFPYDPTTVWARSIGTGPNSSTVTLERYLSAENLSPWNNAIFSGGAGAVPITGNVVIAGSVHILGEGLAATTTVFSNQTGDCRNTNAGMDGTLAAAINGGTTSDLNAKFRVKNGRVDMSVGSPDIGSSASPFKGIYVTTGTDAGADGVNDDIIGGDNSGAGQNLYADKGAFSAQAYDLGDYNISMPSIDTAWMDANCLDLTGTTDVTGGPPNNDPNSATADGETEKGLIAGALELTGTYNVTGTDYFPDIDQNDVTTFEDSDNAIRFNSATNVLEIKGIVKVSTLNISDDI